MILPGLIPLQFTQFCTSGLRERQVPYAWMLTSGAPHLPLKNYLMVLVIEFVMDYYFAENPFILFSSRIYFFRQPFLMVGDPDMIKDILIKEFPKFHDRRVRSFTFQLFSYRQQY